MPRIMGILNVTPDSFSDGGSVDVEAAVAHAEAMVQAGASIIDVGGESTRPGAEPVPAAIEAARVLPVIASLASRRLRAAISVDTYKASVAQAALEAGASIVNDVSMLRDPEMGAVVARSGATVIIMHSRGAPQTMHAAPGHRDVVAEVRTELAEATQRARAWSVDERCIWVDPGLGFGKTFAQNVTLIKELHRLAELGYPVVLGASRKRFLGSIIEQSNPQQRDLATAVMSALVAHRASAQVFRVHHVAATREALAVAGALS